MAIIRSLEDRFWKKVKKTDGCWLWIGGGWLNGGYGGINRGDGKKELAHRVSWVIHYGPIPDGMRVCHTCDNPACVRPEHLFVGTAQDNFDDARRKGRIAIGSRIGTSKLTEHQVFEIMDELLEGISMPRLASRYNVCLKTIENIKYGTRWGHLTAPGA